MSRLFFLNPGLLEVRFMGKGGQTLALFTDNHALAEEATQRPEAAGFDVYQTLNLIRPVAPEKRDVLFRAGRGDLTADANIEKRSWLLLDSDSIRPTGTAATEEQRRAAHDHSRELEAALTAEGWPLPLVCDSGNGAHRLYRVDLPNDARTLSLVSNLLHVMSRRFDNGAVKLDRSVSNAARVTRLYGARNQKAGRDSSALSVPEPIVTVSREQITAVVNKWRGSLGYKKPLTQRTGDWTPERIEAFLDFHNIPYAGPIEKNGGLLAWVLEECPFNSDHVGTSVAVLLTKMGRPKFKCLHNGCAHIKTWKIFVARLNLLNGKVFSWKPSETKYTPS